jgi:hypothetical protein
MRKVAFNQWVAGSSPARLIFSFKELRAARGPPVTLQVDKLVDFFLEAA